MKRSTKIWLITAASLVLIGCIVFVGVMSMLKWDFKKLSTFKYEKNTHEINEVFSSITMNTDTADINFMLSNDGKCKVDCYESENTKPSVTIKENSLIIEKTDNEPWYKNIGINFGSPKITVYLPKVEYTSLLIKGNTGDILIPRNFTFQKVDISLSTGDVEFYASASESVKIKASTGDIDVENISAGSLDLTVSTGEIDVQGVNCEGDITVNVSTGEAELTDLKCKNLISNGNTGSLSFENVIAKEKFSIKRTTGDVKFRSSDAAEISIKTDTGDVVGSLLTDKVFITDTSTGKIDVPKTVTGGKCEIKTDTGKIKITIP